MQKKKKTTFWRKKRRVADLSLSSQGNEGQKDGEKRKRVGPQTGEKEGQGGDFCFSSLLLMKLREDEENAEAGRLVLLKKENGHFFVGEEAARREKEGSLGEHRERERQATCVELLGDERSKEMYQPREKKSVS